MFQVIFKLTLSNDKLQNADDYNIYRVDTMFIYIKVISKKKMKYSAIVLVP